MKLCIPISILFSVTCLITIHAAEKTPLYTIRPYQDSHDHSLVFAMITSQLASLAGQEKAEKEKERLYTKLDNALKHDTPMNKVSFEEGSFQNTLLFDRTTLVGVITYLIKKDDKNCFIDTLCIKPEYTSDEMYKNIINIVLNYARMKKSDHIETYENKACNKDEIDALTKIGFTETPYGDNESVKLTLHT